MPAFPIRAVEETIGYTFQSKELLIQVFRMANGQGNTEERWRSTNAPLAYLGDALIEFLLAEHLTANGHRKGAVPEIRDYAVKTPTLASIFQQLNIVECIRAEGYPFTLQHDGVRDRGELFEALTAAIYRDGGLAAARTWLQRTMFVRMSEFEKKSKGQNPVMLIQHHCQRAYRCNPEYRIVASPANRRQNTFTVELHAAGVRLGKGDETSLKQARKKAAFEACRHLKLL